MLTREVKNAGDRYYRKWARNTPNLRRRLGTLLETYRKRNLTFEDVWERCWKRIENAINEYDKTHEEKFDDQPQKWQIEYSQPIIYEVISELMEKRSGGFHPYFI